MKRLFLFSLFIGQFSFAQQNKSDSLIRKTFENLPENAQLSIALLKDGKVDFKGFEKKNGETKSVSNKNKLFEIGSVTKTFTSTLLANAVLEKKVQLTDEINTRYPFSFKNGIKFTYQELANHTSGLPKLPEEVTSRFTNFVNPYQQFDYAFLENYLKNDVKIGEKKFEYSNIGTSILAMTLMKVYKKDLETLYQEKIFKKYGMLHSTTIRKDNEPDLVKGIDDEGKTVSRWDMNAFTGTGGIVSSVSDMAKYVQAQFQENPELKLTQQKTTDVNDRLSIGLAWHIIKAKDGSLVYFHNGGTGGYTSEVFFDPTKKKAIIILSNISALGKNFASIENLAGSLYKSLK